MNIKKNLPLIFGIAIPLLMIIFVALSIYIPQLFVKPQYNFLYLIGNNNCYIPGGNNIKVYSVQGGTISKNDQAGLCSNSVKGTRFFIYDVSTNKNREVTMEEAINLKLDNNFQSPDGFKIINGSSNEGFFPFFSYSSSDYNTWYLSGHNVSKKINIQQNGYTYYYDFVFLGWINK